MSTGIPPSNKLPKTEKGHISSLPLNAYIAIKMDEVGKSNTQVASELGYEKPNVVAMMRSGSMRLPLNKVAAMAAALECDPIFLLEKVLTETNPELWFAMKPLVGQSLVTQSELRLIQLVRGLMDGLEIDFIDDPDFVRDLKPIVKEIQKKAIFEAKVIKKRLDENKHNHKAGWQEEAKKKKAA